MQKFCLLSLLFVSCALYAQEASSSGGLGSIQGRVIDGQSGDGLAGASLRLFPRGLGVKAGVNPTATVSQDDGSFRFDSLTPATYMLYATHANYANASGNMQTIVVGDESQVQGVTISLSPLGSLSGKVFVAGRPAAGATVQLFRVFSTQGRMQLRRMQNATAEQNGAYLFKKVYPGKYYLAADLSSDQNRISEKTDEAESTPLQTVRSFYPKALNLESASAIEMPAGTSLGDINIRLQRARTFRIRGKVASLTPDGLQRGTSLELTPRDTSPFSGLGEQTKLQADGSFAFEGVQSGSYTLWLAGTYGSAAEQIRRAGHRRILARQDVDVNGGNADDIELSLMPPVDLTGQITLPNGSANASQLQVSLAPVGQVPIGSFQIVKVDADGSFSVRDLPPGEYMVRVVNVPSGMYVQSISLNRQDVTTTGVDLLQGGGGELAVTLKPGVGEVDGTLKAQGSSQAASGTALLVPESLAADGSGVRIANVESGGAFSIRNVPPGRYFAFGIQQWTSIWQNPDFLRAVERDGTTINLQENGHAQIDLTLFTAEQ